MLNLFILVYKKQKDFFQSFDNNLEIVAPRQPPRKSVRGRELVTPWKTCCNRFKSKPYLVLLVNGEHFSQLFHKYTIRLPFDMTSDKLRLQSWFLTYLLYRTNVRRNLSRMLLCRIILKCLLPWYSVLTFFRSCLANLERGRGLKFQYKLLYISINVRCEFCFLYWRKVALFPRINLIFVPVNFNWLK